MIEARRAGGVVREECSQVQEHAWWVKDLTVILRRERTEGRCKVMNRSDHVRVASCTVRLNIEEVMEIRRMTRLKSSVGDIQDLILNTLLNFEPKERL